jgi:hypothetical protein
MLLRRVLSAAILLLSTTSLVSAQVTNENCLLNGYPQCLCTCQVPLINSYCSDETTLTQCSCTNTDYHSALISCIAKADCSDLTGIASTASAICAAYGYSLVFASVSSTSAPTAAATSPASAATTTATATGLVQVSTVTSVSSGVTSSLPIFSTATSTSVGVVAGQSQSPSPSPSGKSGSSLGTGAIAGIAIGGAAVLLIAILGTVFLIQRGSRNRAAAVSIPFSQS